MGKKLTTEEFIRRAKEIHGERYSYGKVKYINSRHKVKIWCKKCKQYFLQSPPGHLKGHKCKKCFVKERASYKETPLTQKTIKDYYNYDPITGDFSYKVSNWGLKKIKKCEDLSAQGYLRASFHDKQYVVHRLIWVYMTGDWPNGVIDHINRDRTDNRWCNLRDVDYSLNSQNRGLQ